MIFAYACIVGAIAGGGYSEVAQLCLSFQPSMENTDTLSLLLLAVNKLCTVDLFVDALDGDVFDRIE